MKNLYSIGETAKINDISIKKLRYYDKIGLLKPRYIDPSSGYRYYTYDQFSFIDKIKRYKNIGIPLKKLKTVFQSQDLSQLETFLKEQRKALEKEEQLLKAKQQDIDWLTDFFTYSKKLQVENSLSIREIQPLQILQVPCGNETEIFKMDTQLRHVIMSSAYRDCQILNPYGYILDFSALMRNEFLPTASTVCIRTSEDKKIPGIFEVPGGKYLCCKAKILSSHWNVDLLIEYCHAHGLTTDFVIAVEYLSSLNDPYHSPYEIRLLLPSNYSDPELENKNDS